MLLVLWLAQPAQAQLYRCPGNLFTNDLDARSAREQGCVPAQTGGFSQASARAKAPMPLEADGAQPLAGPAAAQAAVSLAVAPTSTRSAQPGAGEEREERREERAPAPRAARVEPADQRARDRDALAILQTELQRTLAEQQRLAARADLPSDSPAWQRLRADEQALRRELARFTR